MAASPGGARAPRSWRSACPGELGARSRGAKAPTSGSPRALPACAFGSAIASSSLATEWLKGKTIDEAQKIKNTDIVQELNLPPVKIHCSVLAEDAIKAALSDYKKKAEPK